MMRRAMVELAQHPQYALHELRVELGNEPRAEVFLVDDTAGQVLALSGQSGRVDLTCRGLWDGGALALESLRLEPGARDVAARLALRVHELVVEAPELHSHYRRLAVYERWMTAREPDAPADLPEHLQLLRLGANVPLGQLELELRVGDARQLVVLRSVLALDLRSDSRNRNAFVHQVQVAPIDPATRHALLEASGLRGPQWLALDARLAGLHEVRLRGQDLELTALLRLDDTTTATAVHKPVKA